MDGGGWLALSGADKPLWQESVPAPGPGKHVLEIRALSVEGTGNHSVGFVVGP